MFILPLMTGHLLWKATILCGLYRGVSLYKFCEQIQSIPTKQFSKFIIWDLNLQGMAVDSPHVSIGMAAMQLNEYALWMRPSFKKLA